MASDPTYLQLVELTAAELRSEFGIVALGEVQCLFWESRLRAHRVSRTVVRSIIHSTDPMLQDCLLGLCAKQLGTATTQFAVSRITLFWHHAPVVC